MTEEDVVHCFKQVGPACHIKGRGWVLPCLAEGKVPYNEIFGKHVMIDERLYECIGIGWICGKTSVIDIGIKERPSWAYGSIDSKGIENLEQYGIKNPFK